MFFFSFTLFSFSIFFSLQLRRWTKHGDHQLGWLTWTICAHCKHTRGRGICKARISGETHRIESSLNDMFHTPTNCMGISKLFGPAAEETRFAHHCGDEVPGLLGRSGWWSWLSLIGGEQILDGQQTIVISLGGCPRLQVLE